MLAIFEEQGGLQEEALIFRGVELIFGGRGKVVFRRVVM